MGWLARKLERCSPLLGSAVLCAVVFVAAALRDHAAEWQGRSVWGNLEPLAAAVSAHGAKLTQQALHEFRRLAEILTAFFAVLAALGIWRRFWPLPVASVGGAALAWAWLWLFQGEPMRAVWMFALATVSFVACGFFTRGQALPTSPSSWRRDVPLLVLLFSVALLARLYALTELPNYFIGEMSLSMLAPATWNGLWTYVPEAMQAVSIGCAHLFVQWATYAAFGSSVFAIRATAVVFGAAVVWVLYWLARAIGGRQAAFVAASLAAFAPEQLWWSRNENSYFIAVCFAGAMTAWLSWEVRQRPTAGRILLVCLWMACSRLFYLAAVALFVVPPALLLHGLLFEARQRQRLLVAFLVVSTLGVAGWAMSPTVVSWVGSGVWRFVHPARHGELAAEAAGTSGIVPLLRYQADKVARNALRVGQALVVHSGFDHWYQRVDRLDRSTWINLAAAALAAAGFLLALGQIVRADAALLWLWLAAGLAPALLSEAPDSRRLAAAYPAFYAAAGWLWVRGSAMVSAAAGRWVATVLGTVAWPAVAAIALSSASSHLSLPAREIPLVRTARVVSNDFRHAEAIYYDMDDAAFPLFAAVHADRWLERKPCFQRVGSDWLGTALRQGCRYDDPSLRIVYSPEVQAEPAARAVRPHWATFLIGEVPRREEKLERLRQLFPNAERREMHTEDASYSLAVVRVREADVRQLRQVEIGSVRDAAGRTVRPRMAEPRVGVKAERLARGDEMSIAASLLVDREGWYRFEAVPGCDVLLYELAGQRFSPPGPTMPLLVGLWPLTIRLAASCQAPLVFRWQGVGDSAPPLALFDPALATAQLLRPPAMRVVMGYRFAGRLGEVRGSVIDVRAIADALVVLTGQGSELKLEWWDHSGTPLRTRTLDALGGRVVSAMAAAPDGQLLLLTSEGPVLLHADGSLRARWRNVELPTPDVVWLSPERIVAALPQAGGLVELDAEGHPVAVLRQLAGAPTSLWNPISVARSPDGQTWALVQLDGRLLLFTTSAGIETARFVREISLPLLSPGVWPRSLTFHGAEQLLVAEPERMRILMYAVDGHRLLSREPENDWHRLLAEIGDVRRIVPFGRDVVVLGSAPWLARFQPAEP